MSDTRNHRAFMFMLLSDADTSPSFISLRVHIEGCPRFHNRMGASRNQPTGDFASPLIWNERPRRCSGTRRRFQCHPHHNDSFEVLRHLDGERMELQDGQIERMSCILISPLSQIATVLVNDDSMGSNDELYQARPSRAQSSTMDFSSLSRGCSSLVNLKVSKQELNTVVHHPHEFRRQRLAFCRPGVHLDHSGSEWTGPHEQD